MYRIRILNHPPFIYTHLHRLFCCSSEGFQLSILKGIKVFITSVEIAKDQYSCAVLNKFLEWAELFQSR